MADLQLVIKTEDDRIFYDMPEHVAGMTLADLTSVIERRWRELA